MQSENRRCGIDKHRLRRPVVAVEHTAAQEFIEPFPSGITVVVCRSMETEPSAAGLLYFIYRRLGKLSSTLMLCPASKYFEK